MRGDQKSARIVIATRLFTPEVGAAAFRLHALANGLDRAGARVRVLTTNPPDAVRGDADSPGAHIRRFPVLRDAGGNVRGYLQYLSFDIPLFFRLMLTRADLVVSEPPPTTGLVVALTSLVHRRPYAYYAADVWTDALVALSAPRALIRVMRALEGFVVRRADVIIAVSDEVARKVTALGAPIDRVKVVGNGVNTDMFALEGPVEVTTAPYFVYAGTMSEWQGADIFIKAMPRVLERHPDTLLQFLGQGTDEPHLKRTATRLGVEEHVSFGGVVPPATAARWLRGAAGALASIKPDFGYDFAKPTKVYAAAACGSPVVFAGRGVGTSLVSENGLGLGVDYDVDTVASAMCALLEEQSAGITNALRATRARWVMENASLEASGTRAAEAVLEALGTSKHH